MRYINKFNESLESKEKTSSDFLSSIEKYFVETLPRNTETCILLEDAESAMIEFAKYHVRKAVKEQIRLENDRSDESDLEDMTDEALEHTYPLLAGPSPLGMAIKGIKITATLVAAISAIDAILDSGLLAHSHEEHTDDKHEAPEQAQSVAPEQKATTQPEPVKVTTN